LLVSLVGGPLESGSVVFVLIMRGSGASFTTHRVSSAHQTLARRANRVTATNTASRLLSEGVAAARLAQATHLLSGSADTNEKRDMSGRAAGDGHGQIATGPS
jgi:hypothetical protein